MFSYQTVLLNRLHKTNEFLKIKPRVRSETDRVIYVLPKDANAKTMKLGGTLTKVNYANDDWVEEQELLDYFDIEETESTLIRTSHRDCHGIDR